MSTTFSRKKRFSNRLQKHLQNQRILRFIERSARPRERLKAATILTY
jgi:hypothetical protein